MGSQSLLIFKGMFIRETGERATALRAQLNAAILRPLRIGLVALLAGVVIGLIVDHALMPARPRWADVSDTFAIGLIALAFWLSGRPAVRARPVPFALLVVGVTCAMRALSGIGFGDIEHTAILCAIVALITGATFPWGVWPQLLTVAMAATATAANGYLISSTAGPAAHLVAAVVTALVVSVLLSFEVQRHRLHLFEENLQRRRAEQNLAQLNAELERRVAQRTAELAGAKQRLEREALERLEATQELHDSRKRLQDILDNAPAAVYLKDVDGRYQLVNRHWESISGVWRADAVGRTDDDVFPAGVADAFRANDRVVLASRQPLQVEEIVPQLDGAHTYVSVKFPLFASTGAAVGVCGISTDITAHKQAEAELRRSEAALSALVENTTDSIWSVDLQGTVRVMNAVFRERFRKRFGVDYDRAVSEARLPKAIWKDMQALYARAFAGEHVQVERTYPIDDEAQHFLISVHPIVENGVVTGATVFSKDITERKRVEEQFRQHQADLAHVLRLGTMGEMAAGLAHEINQPLGAIANYAQGSVRRMQTGATDLSALLPVMEEIAAEALRAGEIIRRLRDLVRKETPQQRPVDLNALVRESTSIIEPEARQQGIAVRLDLAPGLPPVLGDGIQIEQVLLNLLLNGVEAVQASSNGDRTVSVITAAADPGHVEVAVRDSGVGIPAPPADVFAPFFSTKRNGLGMGLSISRSIIEAHGGRLWATRNADCGSTFRFTLPVRPPATA